MNQKPWTTRVAPPERSALPAAVAAAAGGRGRDSPQRGGPPAWGPIARSYAAELPQARAEIGTRARPFELGQVRLTASRWTHNQNRTLAYLRFVDVDRLLYNFRANHRLSTQGAEALGGWEAPNFPFRTHSQGHFLTAWAQAWAVLGDTTCRDKATTMVAELAKCQANNGAAGFTTGYLSGFPESDFNGVERAPATATSRTTRSTRRSPACWTSGGCWAARRRATCCCGSPAGWTPAPAGCRQRRCRSLLGIEFGGMNAVFADLYLMTNDERWLTVAQRFDHASVFDPLAANRDQLNGLHANTQVPKWIGAAREYKSTGTTRYRDIARNAWAITVGAHTYAIGGNSEAEHFRPAERDLDVPGQRHGRAVQHLQHAQAHPRAVDDRPRQRGATSTTTSGRCSTTCSAGRTRPTRWARLLLHAAASRWPARRASGPAWGGGTFSTRLHDVLVLPGHRDRVQHQAHGLDLLLRGHHADGQPVHAVDPTWPPATSRSPRPRRTRSGTPRP